MKKLSNEKILENVLQECKSTSLELINIEYNGSRSKVYLKCKEHGVLKPKLYHSFVNTHAGCNDCGIKSQKEKLKSLPNIILDNIQNECTSTGLKFIGFVGGSYVNTRTKIIIECPVHGVLKPKLYNDFVNNHRGCKDCGIESTKEKQKSPLNVVLENIQNECISTGLKFIGFVGGSYVNVHTKLILECPVHGHYSSTSYNAFVNNHCGCNDCGIELQKEKQKIPLNVVLENIQNECISTGLKFIGFVGGSYVNAITKLILECPIHGQYSSTSYNSFVNSHCGCPRCNGHNQTYTYISEVFDISTYAIKYGKETTIGTRAKQQNNRSKMTVHRLSTFCFESPEQCKEAEKECHKVFQKENRSTYKRSGYLTKEQMPDGHTETTTLWNLSKIKEIYQKHGGFEVKNG